MLLCEQAVVSYVADEEDDNVGSESAAVLPLATFFLGLALGLILYPKIIGSHYDEPANRPGHTDDTH